MSKPLYTIQQAIDAMKSFCAYQERSQSEVRRKLSGGMLTDDEIESVIAELISQNYINETRFAELYIQSKINQKKWGLLKSNRV
jgi:regulatory protein